MEISDMDSIRKCAEYQKTKENQEATKESTISEQVIKRTEKVLEREIRGYQKDYNQTMSLKERDIINREIFNIIDLIGMHRLLSKEKKAYLYSLFVAVLQSAFNDDYEVSFNKR